MKLTNRILFLLKATWNDLFGEEPQAELRQAISGDATGSRLTGLLDQAQQRLDVLRLELANGVSRQKRIRQAWQDVLPRIDALNVAVDEALKAEDEEKARTILAQLNPLEKEASELAELARVCEKHTAEVRAAINTQQDQLDALRRRSLLLEDRESNIAALTELFGAQQSISQQTSALQTELIVWEEQIARREDKLAARREWSK
jgi:phage shock protein A